MNVAYNCDCMDYMKNIKDKEFDLAIVDPPYRNMNENRPTKDMRASGTMKRFGDKPDKFYFDELFRVSKNQIIWGANNFQLPQFKGFVVWEKGIPEDFTMSMAEIASLSEGIGTISKVVNIRASGQENRIHPTQKPIALYEWLLIHYAKKGDVIFDTHLGSGSSRIAAYNLGFDFVGCEIDKNYFEEEEERFKNHTAQQSLFVKE